MREDGARFEANLSCDSATVMRCITAEQLVRVCVCARLCYVLFLPFNFRVCVVIFLKPPSQMPLGTYLQLNKDGLI